MTWRGSSSTLRRGCSELSDLTAVPPVFDFVDLFAGVGGFHAALTSLGGRGVQAAEIEPNAARVYEQNWDLRPDQDVRQLGEDPAVPGQGPRGADRRVSVPAVQQVRTPAGHELRNAGPSSTTSSRILEVKQPPVVMLENVRNLAGPRQRDAWGAVVAGLRGAGYRVSDEPCVFSPHLLSPEDGGAPQMRERRLHPRRPRRARARTRRDRRAVTVANKPQQRLGPARLDDRRARSAARATRHARQRYVVDGDEAGWIDTWNELLATAGPARQAAGPPDVGACLARTQADASSGCRSGSRASSSATTTSTSSNRSVIDAWRRAHPEITAFPLSRRKLEWQAQDGTATCGSTCCSSGPRAFG